MVKTNWKLKASLFGLFGLGYLFFYVMPNLHSFFLPVLLPQSFVDIQTPIVPWTFLIYTSDYFFILWAIVVLKDAEFFAFARMMFAALVLCGAFFIFFPTTYPRPEYPEVSSRFLAMVMQFVREGDKPTNCFPSMHVALTGIAVWCMRFKPRWMVLVSVVWTLLIYVSTLTTKQHYLMDILGGIGVVIASGWLEYAYALKRVSLKAWFSR